jgi:hypothetical protein
VKVRLISVHNDQCSAPQRENLFTQFHSENSTGSAYKDGFARQFIEYVESDCLIIGGGPSGLMAGRDIASRGVKTLIVERNNYIGGGFWIGGYLMNKVTVREPGQKILEELGIPYEKAVKGLYVADGPHACSKLIAAARRAGVPTPLITDITPDTIVMERVQGDLLTWALSVPNLEEAGRMAGRLHKAGIMHGDLRRAILLFVTGAACSLTSGSHRSPPRSNSGVLTSMSCSTTTTELPASTS